MGDHKLDEATRQKLLTRLPFSRNSTIDFTPKVYLTKALDANGVETEEFEIPEEYRPVFKCRPFSIQDKAKIKDKNPDDKVLKEVIRKNIIGLEQMYDAGTMEEITFKADEDNCMSLDQFETIPVMIQRELFSFIAGISGLSSYERSGL